MKQIKKINNKSISRVIYITVLCGVLLLLASCTSMFVSDSNNPRLTWQKFSEYISDGDYEGAFGMTGNGSVSSESSVSESDTSALIMKKLSECYSYKFVSDTDVTGVTAMQEVEITTIDMRKLATAAVSRSVESAKDHAYKNGSYKTDEEVSAAVSAKIAELLNSPEEFLIKVQIRAEFVYKGGKWVLMMNDEIYDTVTGYLRYADEAIDEYNNE